MWLFLESSKDPEITAQVLHAPCLFSSNGDWNSYFLCYCWILFSKDFPENGPQTVWCFLETCMDHSWPLLLWPGNAVMMLPVLLIYLWFGSGLRVFDQDMSNSALLQLAEFQITCLQDTPLTIRLFFLGEGVTLHLRSCAETCLLYTSVG